MQCRRQPRQRDRQPSVDRARRSRVAPPQLCDPARQAGNGGPLTQERSTVNSELAADTPAQLGDVTRKCVGGGRHARRAGQRWTVRGPGEGHRAGRRPAFGRLIAGAGHRVGDQVRHRRHRSRGHSRIVGSKSWGHRNSNSLISPNSPAASATLLDVRSISRRADHPRPPDLRRPRRRPVGSTRVGHVAGGDRRHRTPRSPGERPCRCRCRPRSVRRR